MQPSPGPCRPELTGSDLTRTTELLAILNRAYAQALAQEPPRLFFKELLTGILHLTGSKSGFIGEILPRAADDPSLKIHIATDLEAESFFPKGGLQSSRQLLFHSPCNLIRPVITSGEALILNQPSSIRGHEGLPVGHPPIRSFLGIPFSSGGKLNGMIGIANRPGGYDQQVIDFLQPLLETCGNLIACHRIELLSRQAREDLHIAHRQQVVIDSLLRLGFSDLSLEEQLEQALAEIATIPWLPLTPKGGIFLIDEGSPGRLFLRAQKALDFEVRHRCASIRIGECLCGLCAAQKKTIFRDRITGDHSHIYPGMTNHGHYLLPIISRGRLLGVLNLYTQAGHQQDTAEEKFLTTVCQTLAGLIEKKKAEESLRNSEANLLRTQQIAHLGYWEWDIVNDRFTWSPEIYRIVDLGSAQYPLLDYHFFLGLVHPEDRFAFQKAMESALDDEKPFKIEHRLELFDGSAKFVRQEGEITRSQDGKPVRMLGIMQDITENKHSEAQINLATRIFESSIEGIIITDPPGAIQMVNPAFTNITGYTAGEVIGKNPRLLKSDRQNQEFYRRMWEAIRKEGGWQGEVWNRRKNGEIYPEWLTVTSIKNHMGQVTNYAAIFHDMTEIRQKEAQLRYQTDYDALTGLPNRLMLRERLKVALSRNRHHQENMAVLVIDLDNFKNVNDSLGHTVGDLLLQETARRCQALLPEDTTISRLGGDDFCVILEGLENERRAVELAEKLIASLSKPFLVDSHELYLTMSIGITFSPADGDMPETLIGNAELAMYRAKEQGKNKYRLFTRSMNDRVVRRLKLENSMRRALEREEFQLYYQPKVELGQGRIVGMEALLRWEQPGVGLVLPAEFIPLAEENGLIVPIGEWVLACACHQVQQWRAAGHELTVAVNLSPRQFSQHNLLAQIEAALAEAGLPPHALQLEITEGLVLDHQEEALELLGKLRVMGVKIAMDDFGTGYSSLHYLRQLPIDTLKIDRSFIRDLPADKDGLAITAAILSMAASLNLEVVAEGVETEEHLSFLCQKGCNLVQGYLFSPPLPARAFADLLSSNVTFHDLINGCC